MSVKKDVIRPSDGRQVKAGDKITVHCTGSLTNPPKKFWRSAISRILHLVILLYSQHQRSRTEALHLPSWSRSGDSWYVKFINRR